MNQSALYWYNTTKLSTKNKEPGQSSGTATYLCSHGSAVLEYKMEFFATWWKLFAVFFCIYFKWHCQFCFYNFVFFLLRYSFFMMLCSFLVYNEVNQLHTHTSPPLCTCFPHPHPIYLIVHHYPDKDCKISIQVSRWTLEPFQLPLIL